MWLRRPPARLAHRVRRAHGSLHVQAIFDPPKSAMPVTCWTAYVGYNESELIQASGGFLSRVILAKGGCIL